MHGMAGSMQHTAAAAVVLSTRIIITTSSSISIICRQMGRCAKSRATHIAGRQRQLTGDLIVH